MIKDDGASAKGCENSSDAGHLSVCEAGADCGVGGNAGCSAEHQAAIMTAVGDATGNNQITTAPLPTNELAKPTETISVYTSTAAQVTIEASNPTGVSSDHSSTSATLTITPSASTLLAVNPDIPEDSFVVGGTGADAKGDDNDSDAECVSTHDKDLGGESEKNASLEDSTLFRKYHGKKTPIVGRPIPCSEYYIPATQQIYEALVSRAKKLPADDIAEIINPIARESYIVSDWRSFVGNIRNKLMKGTVLYQASSADRAVHKEVFYGYLSWGVLPEMSGAAEAAKLIWDLNNLPMSKRPKRERQLDIEADDEVAKNKRRRGLDVEVATF